MKRKSSFRVRVDDILDGSWPAMTSPGDRRYIDVEAGYGERLRMRNAIARLLEEKALVERKARA